MRSSIRSVLSVTPRRDASLRRAFCIAVTLILVALLLPGPLFGLTGGAGQASAAEVLPPIVPSAPGFGRTAGSFAVSDGGAARYTVPLWVPHGRGSVEPRLSLSYDSGGGNGLVGVGWGISGLSSIAPCARTIAQDGHSDGVRFDGGDAFCLDGVRLMPVTPLPEPPAQLQEREYRTEQESFSKIVGFGMVNNVPTYFRVWTKDLRILTFGQTADSRRQAFQLMAGPQANTLVQRSTTRVTLSWDLNRIEDRNGNFATVEYERAEGTADQLWSVESRPSVIRYAPNRTISFTYASRPDPIESYGRGVHLREPKRLSRISMHGGPTEPLRTYRLAYEEDAGLSITKRSLLASVTECDGGDVCKRPVTFDWSKGSYEFQTIDTAIRDGGQYRSRTGPAEDEQYQGRKVDNQIVVGDYDGDGRDDILYPNTDDWLHVIDNTDDPARAQQKWFLRLSNGAGFGPARPAGFSPPVYDCFTAPPGENGQECTAGQGRVNPIDVDLDGKLEVLVWVPVDATHSRWRLLTFDGTKFVPHSSGLQGPVEQGNYPDPVLFADLDGNGTPDFVTAPEDHRAWDPPGSGAIDGPWTYRLNTGQGGSGRFAAAVVTGRTVPNTTPKVIDANADGRADLIGPGGTGWGLNNAGAVESRVYANRAANSPMEGVAADVNGDGLDDAVSAFTKWREDVPMAKGRLVAALSSGNGVGPHSQSPSTYWEPEWRRMPTPPPGGEPQLTDFAFNRGVHYVDFNGDGADDVLVFRGHEPSADDPTRFGAQLYLWRNGRFEWAPLNREAGNWGPGGFSASRTLDIDGDGMLDILHVKDEFESPDGAAKGQLRILKRTGGVPDRIIGIGNAGYRERIEIDYTPLSNRDVHIPTTNCTFPQLCLTKGGAVVAQHRNWTFATSGGAAGWDTFTHIYLGAKADTIGRGSLGVASHIVTRALTGAQTVTQFDNTTRDAAMKAYPLAGRIDRVTTTVKDNPNGREHQSIIDNAYDVRRHPGGGYSVEPKQVSSIEQEHPASGGAWTILRQDTTTNAFDNYGNVERSTTATVAGRTVVHDPEYRNDTDAWLIGLTMGTETKACTWGATVPCKVRVSDFDYDDRGNRVLAITEPDRPDLWLSTVTDYDSAGNAISVTATDTHGIQRRARFEYDADKVHLNATINALDHRTEIETHSGLGVPVRTTDANGVTTTKNYDGFGRLRGISHADGSFERITHTAVLGADITTTTSAGGAVSAVTTDPLGRHISTQEKTFAGTTAITSLHHDPLGRVRAVSRPKGPGEQDHYTITEYDNRDRPTRVTAPDGVVTRTEYFNRETHRYDGRNIHSYTVTNADGKTEFSYEDDPESTGWLRTRFEYGPFGEITKAEAADNTQQVLLHDDYGRRTRLQDPSTGVTETQYNAFGEAKTEIDGNGNTTSIGRDALGRVTTTTSPDGTMTNVWDTAAYGKGLLARATSTDGVVTVSTYTEHSKPQSTTWTVEGTGYRIDYSYDTLGRQSGITYPAIPGGNGRLAVTYGYNASGYLRDVRNAAGSQVYWTGEERDSAGQLTKERLGDGSASVVGTRRYNTVGLLTGITVDGTVGGQMSNIDYVYDENRNVVKRQDNVNARPDRYGYDSLNRLQTWRLTASDVDIVTGYNYDSVGNLESETVDGHPERNVAYGYRESGAPPHALATRNGIHYDYDDAGRQISGAGRTVTYNQAGLPKTLNWGQSQQTQFRYDAAGDRVLKRDGGNTLLTIGGLFERRIPEAGAEIHNLHNIVVGGRTVAQIDRTQPAPTGPAAGPVALYLHGDLQGSTVLVTNAAGRPADTEGSWLREMFYDPHGRRVQADGTPMGNQRRGGPHQGYTGHEFDGEFGLINMKGRIYDPEQRRFLTPDSVIPDPLSSQDHNRYAYVRNNPATLIDPTGHTSLRSDMLSNSSYYGTEGTDRTLTMAYDDLSDGRRMGLAIEERLASSDGLKYLGGGGPQQLNATPADATRSDSDGSSRTPQAASDAEEYEEVDIDGGGANDLDGNGVDDDYETDACCADGGTGPAADGVAAGIFGWFNKVTAQYRVGRAIDKAVETGLNITDGKVGGAAMRPDPGEYTMKTEKQQLARAAELENAPVRGGGTRGNGVKLGARAGGAMILLMFVGVVTDALYTSDYFTERRARKNGISVEQQRSNDECANQRCS